MFALAALMLVIGFASGWWVNAGYQKYSASWQANAIYERAKRDMDDALAGRQTGIW